MVERIEQLALEFESPTFAEWNFLGDGYIVIETVWPIKVDGWRNRAGRGVRRQDRSIRAGPTGTQIFRVNESHKTCTRNAVYPRRVLLLLDANSVELHSAIGEIVERVVTAIKSRVGSP